VFERLLGRQLLAECYAHFDRLQADRVLFIGRNLLEERDDVGEDELRLDLQCKRL